jgi:hypothetical protein
LIIDVDDANDKNDDDENGAMTMRQSVNTGMAKRFTIFQLGMAFIGFDDSNLRKSREIIFFLNTQIPKH